MKKILEEIIVGNFLSKLKKNVSLDLGNNQFSKINKSMWLSKELQMHQVIWTRTLK